MDEDSVPSMTGKPVRSGPDEAHVAYRPWAPYAMGLVVFGQRCEPCVRRGTSCVAEWERGSCIGCGLKKSLCWWKWEGEEGEGEGEWVEELKAEVERLRERVVELEEGGGGGGEDGEGEKEEEEA